jgi:AcrR family transcriptional regulator
MSHHAAMNIPRQSRAEQGRVRARPSIIAMRARGRPTREEADLLRQSILKAALEQFISQGFQAASMEAIARSAGVAKITLYRHFDTKEVLFLQVVRRAQLRVRNSLDAVIDRNAPLERVLREVIEKLYLGYTDPQYLAVSRIVIAEAGRFPRLGRALLNDTKYMTQPLVEYLEYLKERGQVDMPSAYDAATQVAGLASGAGRYVLVAPSRHPQSRRRWVESLVTLFTLAWRADIR